MEKSSYPCLEVALDRHKSRILVSYPVVIARLRRHLLDRFHQSVQSAEGFADGKQPVAFPLHGFPFTRSSSQIRSRINTARPPDGLRAWTSINTGGRGQRDISTDCSTGNRNRPAATSGFTSHKNAPIRRCLNRL